MDEGLIGWLAGALGALLGGGFAALRVRRRRAARARASFDAALEAAVAEQFRKEKERGLSYDLHQRVVATRQRLMRSHLKFPISEEALSQRLRAALKR